MHNAIDFSKIKRIKPREDSWEKVCARLDELKTSKIISFSWYSAIPLVASFIFIGISVLLSGFFNSSATSINIQNITSEELSAWYNNLGDNSSDEFDSLDESLEFTYLQKENNP